ncbi:MAG: hypothetical protein HC920_18480 [Oscillatoriales cyanobacterium SM2_3_0]|nr:hypothetical protein [Oscillatoriales cyanobacterium SM2_3_0]
MANSALKTPGIATFLREQILNLVQQEFPESRIVDTSVKRINRGLEFVYQSAIALQLAALTGQNAFQIANLIDHRWRTGIDQPETVPDMKNMKKRFRLEIQPSGMMLFKLLPDGVADWLQTMTQDPQSNSFPNFEVASPTQNQSQNPAQFAMIPLGRKNSKPGSTNFHSTNFHSTNFHSTNFHSTNFSLYKLSLYKMF